MLKELRVIIKRLNKDLPLPEYKTEGSAGLDLYANIKEPITLQQGDTVVIPTGIAVSLPPNYELQVRARSGLALHNNLTVLNGVGTIDSDYTGEIGVILYYAPTRTGLRARIVNLLKLANLLDVDVKEPTVTIYPKDRIAQAVITKYERVRWAVAEELPQTARGDKGYGSTGVNTEEEL